MSGPTVACRNCGHPNPDWAQICRNCGQAMKPSVDGSDPAPTSRIPFITESAMLAMGAALGIIALAIVAGLFLGGIVPPAPIETASPTPSASESALPSASEAAPSVSQEPSVEPTPALPGTLTFGLGLDRNTRRVVNETNTFSPGTIFAHSIEMPSAFGTSTLGEEIVRLEGDGSQTIVADRNENTVPVNAGASIVGFTVDADPLINDWGAGTYVMRIYRGAELIAQAQFILTT